MEGRWRGTYWYPDGEFEPADFELALEDDGDGRFQGTVVDFEGPDPPRTGAVIGRLEGDRLTLEKRMDRSFMFERDESGRPLPPEEFDESHPLVIYYGERVDSATFAGLWFFAPNDAMDPYEGPWVMTSVVDG